MTSSTFLMLNTENTYSTYSLIHFGHLDFMTEQA